MPRYQAFIVARSIKKVRLRYDHTWLSRSVATWVMANGVDVLVIGCQCVPS
ncbi:hypothetical protein [Vibrio nigripulchritudo]|uniref:hypothetical protein n=1 Tax=Vibrio nigripulchritudo TaxID=28173 RepID=UPI0012D3568D|nr:hypothetical protein [Vibrio nigripulchritudo]